MVPNMGRLKSMKQKLSAHLKNKNTSSGHDLAKIANVSLSSDIINMMFH